MPEALNELERNLLDPPPFPPGQTRSETARTLGAALGATFWVSLFTNVLSGSHVY